MKTYKVILINGPVQATMPIKAFGHEHAMRIAQSMGLGRVVRVIETQ
jgi:hypothetical protein